MAQPERPVIQFRLGLVKAAVWQNRSSNGVRHNVTVCRLYKDDSGNWRDSNSFGRDDLPLLIKVLDEAHTWIFRDAE